MRGRLLQRAALRMRLHQLAKAGNSNAHSIASSADLFDEFYALTMHQYVAQTGAAHSLDESQTPILDKLLEFVKWMYESGFLEWLVKLFMGAAMEAGEMVATAHVVDEPARDSAVKAFSLAA